MTAVERLLGEFADAWKAGERPDVATYLRRASGDAERDELAAQLATLRDRAGLAVRDVAQRLVAAFGLDDEPRAASYLARAERDELDAERLSRRLLDALAAILGADRDLLAPLPSAAAAARGQALFRSDADPAQWVAGDIDALSRAALAPAPPAPSVPQPPMDELDRLFLGGPDA